MNMKIKGKLKIVKYKDKEWKERDVTSFDVLKFLEKEGRHSRFHAGITIQEELGYKTSSVLLRLQKSGLIENRSDIIAVDQLKNKKKRHGAWIITERGKQVLRASE